MKYRLTIYPAIEETTDSLTFYYDTIEQLSAANDSTADLLLYLQDKAKIMKDYSNVFIGEEKKGNDWFEIEL